MAVETVNTCPLGSVCERVVDGKLEVCAWYTKISGKHPQTDEDINESRCAVAWIPILSVDSTGTNRQIAAAIQNLQAETVKRQDVALGRLNGKLTNGN